MEALAAPIFSVAHSSRWGVDGASWLPALLADFAARALDPGLDAPLAGESADDWLVRVVLDLTAASPPPEGDPILHGGFARLPALVGRAEALEIEAPDLLYFLMLVAPELVCRYLLARAAAWRPPALSVPPVPVLARPVDETWVLFQEWRQDWPDPRRPDAIRALGWVLGAATEEPPDLWTDEHPQAAALAQEAVCTGARRAAMALATGVSQQPSYATSPSNILEGGRRAEAGLPRAWRLRSRLGPEAHADAAALAARASQARLAPLDCLNVAQRAQDLIDGLGLNPAEEPGRSLAVVSASPLLAAAALDAEALAAAVRAARLGQTAPAPPPIVAPAGARPAPLDRLPALIAAGQPTPALEAARLALTALLCEEPPRRELLVEVAGLGAQAALLDGRPSLALEAIFSVWPVVEPGPPALAAALLLRLAEVLRRQGYDDHGQVALAEAARRLEAAAEPAREALRDGVQRGWARLALGRGEAPDQPLNGQTVRDRCLSAHQLPPHDADVALAALRGAPGPWPLADRLTYVEAAAWLAQRGVTDQAWAAARRDLGSWNAADPVLATLTARLARRKRPSPDDLRDWLLRCPTGLQ